MASLGSVTINSNRYCYKNQWDAGTYSTLKAQYAGTNNEDLSVCVDKITLPSFSNPAYDKPYTIKYTISILKGTSKSSTSGTLHAYLCDSDPCGARYATHTNSTPSSYIGYGSVNYSGLTQNHQYWTVDINVSNTDLQSGQTYYIWMWTSSFTHLHYDAKVSGTLEGTPVYVIAYNKNGGSGTTSSQTVTAGSSVTLRNNGFTAPAATSASYTITLNGNGGTPNATSKTCTRTTSKTFECWTQGSTSGTKYNAGASFKPTSDTTFYAKWKSSTTGSVVLGSAKKGDTSANGYTVTFNGNGGTPSKTTAQASDKTTYAFGGWGTTADDKSVNYNATSSYEFNANTTVFAIWTPSTTKGSITTATVSRNDGAATARTVTFNANGGSCSPTSAQSNAAITYTCKGWYTKKTNGTKRCNAGGSYTPTKTETLYAQWNSSTGNYSAITLPTAAQCTRTGYTLAGFSENASSSTATYSPGGLYTPSKDITLYAVWSQDNYTITITGSGYGTVKNGSTTLASGAKVPYGTVLTITPTNATGYTTKASPTGQYTVTSNTTIKFTRTANKYYVYYKQGTASSSSNLPSTQKRTYPNSIKLASNSMIKNTATTTYGTVRYNNGTATGGTLPSAQTIYKSTYYAADGWTTSSSDGTDNKTHANGASYGSSVASNLTLYPNFSTSSSIGSVKLGTNSMSKSNTTAGSYTVTLNPNGGTCSTSSLSATRTIKYIANGWTTTSGSASRSHSNGAVVSSSLTLYPCFTQTETVAAVTLPNATRTGYTFAGWSNSSSATSGTVGSYTPSGNVTLYAVWTTNSYILRINPNGGYRTSDNSTSVITVTKTIGQTERISERKRTGYTLTGYRMTNTSSGSTSDVGGATFSFDSSTKVGTFKQGSLNITLTAQWSPNIYKVTLDNQGASSAGTSAYWYKYNTTATINGETVYYYTNAACTSPLSGYRITIPQKRGYTFGGYYTGTGGTGTQFVNSNGYCVNNLFSNNASDITLYADWNPLEYTISYDANTGTGSMDSHTVKYGENVKIKDNAFTKLGYKFAGWTTNSNGTPDGHGWSTSSHAGWSGTWSYIDGQYGISGGKLKLYARWEPYGTVRIYIKDEGWRLAIPYIYQEGKGWTQAMPYAYSGGWKIVGG